MIQGAIYNAAGKVAIRYKEPIPKYASVNGHEYVFDVRYSVALAWVDENDVAALLATPPSRSECCGGGAGSKFFLANQASINCWTDGSR